MTRLNFIRAPQPLTGWRLALLAVGLLALVPAALSWIAHAQAVSHLEAQLAQTQPHRAARPALAPAQQKELDQQVKAVAEAVRQLNLPIARLIKTIQAPRDVRVALLALDLNSQPSQDDGAAANSTTPAGGLKIAAEAETAQDMINYLAYLNQQPIFRSVYLVKHETSGEGADRPYHFQLEAQWRQ